MRRALVTVRSEPPGARIYKDNSYIGTEPVELSHYLEGEFSRRTLNLGTFTAKREGYAPGLRQISLDIPEGIRDAKHSGDVIGETWTFYYDIVIELGNPLAGPTPPAIQQQQQQQQTVIVSGGQSETQQMGTVMVSSNVQGADVYVDGVFVGNTPANLKLKDGIHIIEVKKSGYSTYRRELRVFGGSELSLLAELNQ
jgi:hypothetical protein